MKLKTLVIALWSLVALLPGASAQQGMSIDGNQVVTTATDQDTLDGLACAAGDVATWNGAAWVCTDENLVALDCSAGQVAQWSGSAWACADLAAQQTCSEFFEIVPHGSQSGIFVIPHLFEASGESWDTVIYAAFVDGFVPDTTYSTVDIYLHQDSGDLMASDQGSDICGPCVFDFAIDRKKVVLDIEDLILQGNTGVFVIAGEVSGYAMIVLNGAIDYISLMGVVRGPC